MFRISLRDVIKNTKEMLMPSSHENFYPDAEGFRKALLFSFDCSVSFYQKNGTSISDRRSIWVLIVASHSAFMFIPKEDEWPGRWKEIELNRWENVGNHDTCWIDAVESRINEVYFSMCEKVNPNIAPKDLSLNCFQGIIADKPWRTMRAKHIKDESKPDNYWRILTELEEVTASSKEVTT